MFSDAITQGAAGASSSGQSTRSGSDAQTASADFESFLQLLTAQMRNQDPLSPIDSTQFVEQLASFSTVEQQIQTNSLLEDMVAGMTASDLSNASQWVGRTVEAASPTARFDGSPMSFRIPDGVDGSPLEAIVYSAGGDITRRIGLEPGQVAFSWDGANGNGEPAAPGDYVVEINFTRNGQIVEQRPPNALFNVAEARVLDGEARLILDNGAVIAPLDIRAVHAASDAGSETAADASAGDRADVSQNGGETGSETLPGDA